MDAIREQLCKEVAVLHEIFKAPIAPWEGAPELLEAAALLVEKHCSVANTVSSNLRRIGSLLKKAEIVGRGGTPLLVVCSICQVPYSAKEGGECYPENKRVSHGYCPPCFDTEMSKIS